MGSIFSDTKMRFYPKRTKFVHWHKITVKKFGYIKKRNIRAYHIGRNISSPYALCQFFSLFIWRYQNLFYLCLINMN